MVMKQTFTKESIFINDGEIEIWDGETLIGASETFLWKHVDCIILDRKEFVKPVERATVEGMAIVEFGKMPTIMQRCLRMFTKGFKAGYNANPNEFTREQVVKMLHAATGSVKDFVTDNDGFIDSFMELSIPESVTIENNQVISVVWK